MAEGEKAPPLTPWRLLRTLRRHPSGLLLAVQLLGILLYPLMEHAAVGRALFGAFGIVVLSLVLWVVNRSQAVNWIAWALAIPAVLLSLLANFAAMPSLLSVAYLLEALLYFYASIGLIYYMLDDQRITVDELVAAAATFTLLAWGFAYAFSVCQAWYPGSFSGAGPGEVRSWLELLFLSFSMISGVGLSDIVPVTSPARALSMLAMFSGVMYIAIVVSRLISLTVVRHQAR
ncbi:potassium channel family protein [Luteimonas aquatica]|uniref:potassium channel family protein n=1 Tax=Luteimonas aquatica TaxID=450364 RepID=UPI001F5A6B74|nr:potassium channel family protein [Luteimonas aquatica]